MTNAAYIKGNIKKIDTEIFTYFSQFGQDKFLDQEIFKGMKKGFFVDIGAYDGITVSNTYFFEKYRNWQGICVEPIPSRFEQLKLNRNAICVNGCISNQGGTAKFLHLVGGERYDIMGSYVTEDTEYPKVRGREHTEMLSGLLDNYHPEHCALIEKELKELGGEKELLEVQCYTFSEMMALANRTAIDYLSIDTEGSEYTIFSSIDFDKFDIQVISVEILYPDIPIKSLIEQKGYELVCQRGYDHIYKKR